MEVAVEAWKVRRAEKAMGRSALLEVHDNVGTGTIFSIRYFSAVHTTPSARVLRAS